MGLPANLPDARTMCSLGWLIHGDDTVDSGDTILVAMPGGGTWCVLNEEIVKLEERGWLDLSKDEHYGVPEKGVYWYERWRREVVDDLVEQYAPRTGPTVVVPVSMLKRRRK